MMHADLRVLARSVVNMHLLIASFFRSAIIGVSAMKATPHLVPRLDDVGQLYKQFVELDEQEHDGSEGSENVERHAIPVHAKASEESSAGIPGITRSSHEGLAPILLSFSRGVPPAGG
jgi:hypothetical protein